MNSRDADKRARDRRHDAKRAADKPWRAWYRSKEWRAKAGRQLRDHPWCALCQQRGERNRATIADHVEPHRGDWAKFWRGALQSLCAHHHNATKQAIERGNRAGCDAAGFPTDPGHPWGGG